MFVDSVGFGIGARVIAQRNVERRRVERNQFLRQVYRDNRVYTMATLQTLLSATATHDFGVTIVADGQTRTFSRLAELLVKGTRIYAGRWVIDRTSKHDDGLFEVMAFPDNRQWVTGGLLALVDNIRLEDTLATAGISQPSPFRASQLSLRFHVQNGSPMPAVQVDGDEFPAAEQASIAVIPRALRLIVP
jgi:diacylglycerol kinase family enzyme